MAVTSTKTGVTLESLKFWPNSETYRVQYDQETTPASMAVLATLSEVMDVDPIELEPLHYALGTDALDELLRNQGTRNGAVNISFTFEGYAITVSNDGVVAITPSGCNRTTDPNKGATHR